MSPVLRKQKECCSGDTSCCSSSEADQECCSSKEAPPAITPTSAELTGKDIFGAFKARWAVGRMGYSVTPGLYSLGTPDKHSPVFVSANYKLSFDTLRKNLTGIDSYILVLDTDGINVWCAAGKGTFGTDELVNRINDVSLDSVVGHREVIVPQLGAPGIAAYEVKKLTGFKVTYGPVRASDIPAFMELKKKPTPEMRKVRFTLYDRLVLIPVEIVIGMKKILLLSLILFLISGLYKDGFSLSQALSSGWYPVYNLISAFLFGAILGPLFLPFLPGRAFSIKGIIPGVASFFVSYGLGFTGSTILPQIGYFCLMTAVASFTVMNFTGASTYTSLSGVQKEMKIALPIQAVGFLAGLIIWVISLFK